jgi:hypothetical protein
MDKNLDHVLKNFFLPTPLSKWLASESKRTKTPQKEIVRQALVAWRIVNKGYKP